MSRILQHILVDGEDICQICGSNRIQINYGLGCIWRDVPDERTNLIRPEPKEREYAVFDREVISNRILELKTEKDNMINHHVEEDETGTDWNGLLA